MKTSRPPANPRVVLEGTLEVRVLEKVTGFFGANRKALRFLTLFALFFGGLYFLFGVVPGVRLGVVKPYTVFLARAVAWVANQFGAGVWTDGAMVQSPRFSMNIAMGCDGMEASSLFAAGVLAFPTSFRAKLIGVALGLPLIHMLNLARLVGLYYAGVYFPSSFEEVHIYVAQTIIILLSTAILIFWLERFAVKHRTA